MNLKALYEKKKGQEVIWWGASSCTKTIEVMETFIGGGEKTIFTLKAFDCVDIKQFSHFQNEDEILLLPCSFLKVVSVLQVVQGVVMIQLEQVEPPFCLFE